MRAWLVFSALILAGCRTWGGHVSSDKEAWINVEDRGLYYCDAYAIGGPYPYPVCYRAQLMVRDDPRSEAKAALDRRDPAADSRKRTVPPAPLTPVTKP